MRRWTNKRGGGLRRTTAAGLVPLLLLASVPGCTARHMPDWSTVQAVKPSTKTEVQLYEDEALLEHGEKIDGRIRSTTDESITLDLKDRMDALTLQKSAVRKVSTHRPFWKRWPGWTTFAVASAITGFSSISPDVDLSPAWWLLFIGPPTLLGFVSSPKERIYEVPPQYRKSSRTTEPLEKMLGNQRNQDSCDERSDSGKR